VGRLLRQAKVRAEKKTAGRARERLQQEECLWTFAYLADGCLIQLPGPVLPARFGSCGVYPAHRRLRPAARLFVDGLMEQPRRGPGPPSQAMSQEVFQPLSLQVEGHLDSHRLCARGFDTAA